MPRSPVVTKLTRVRSSFEPGQPTLHFLVHRLGGRHEFLPPDQVPEFEGEEAWFELERIRGPVWMTWRVLRQVEPPPGEAHKKSAPAEAGAKRLGWSA